MVREKKFKDEFWDPDYCGTSGFDVLVRKMKDSHKMCKEVEDFLKQRSKHEEDYAKNLQKLAKSGSSIGETGTLRVSWEKMKQELEKTAGEHFEAAKQYYEEAIRTGQFADQQRTSRKVYEDSVNKCNKNKVTLNRKVADSKKTYDTKCRDTEQQDMTVENYKTSGQVQMLKPQEWEKMITKQTKAYNDAKHANKTYKENLQALEDTRKQWKREMTAMCEAFEKLEENRINFLRNELWVITNVTSQTCVDVDNHGEEVRKVLERCDIDTDIADFINRSRVGKNPPGEIVFQEYISQYNNKPRPPQQLPASRPHHAPPASQQQHAYTQQSQQGTMFYRK